MIMLLIMLMMVVTITSEKFRQKDLSVKRILSEFRDVNQQGISFGVPFNTTNDECGVRLAPIGRNMLEWHFSFTGIEGTPYQDGIYHGKIMLHPEYPRKAPSICVLTPNGRWEVGKPICLSASAYHQETWDPNWNLRTLVMALRGHMLTQPREIGAISTTPDRQRNLAQLSRIWECQHCKLKHNFLCPGHEFERNLAQPVFFADKFEPVSLKPMTVRGTLKKDLKKDLNRRIKAIESRKRRLQIFRVISIMALSFLFSVLACHAFLSQVVGSNGKYVSAMFG